MRCLWLVLLCVTLVGAKRQSLYGTKSKVTNLQGSNFDKKVLEDDMVWLVEFYAPWCGHCQQMAPEYNGAAAMLNGIVKLGAVDCDSGQSGNLCQKYQIEGFPTILAFAAEARNKASHPQHVHEHDRQSLVNRVLRMLPSKFVIPVNDRSTMFFPDEGMEQDDGMPRALLFTSKTSTTPMYKALALALNGRMKLGEVQAGRGGATAMVEQFGVTKFPKLLALPHGAGAPVEFGGKLGFPELLEFLEQYAIPNPADQNHYSALDVPRDADAAAIKKAFRAMSLKYHPDKNPGNPAANTKFEAAASAYEVLGDEESRTIYDHELDSDNGEIGDFYTRNKDIKNVESWGDLQYALQSGDIWIVEYYLPWCEPCQTFSAQFKKIPVAIEAAGITRRVRLAAVNCDTQEQACNNMGVQSYPEIQMFTPNSKQPEVYRDGEKTASKVVEWIQLQVDSPVQDLYSISDFRQKVLESDDLWLVDFYHPRCGPCNAIKGTVRRTASQLKGLAKVGMFDCVQSDETEQFCREQGVDGYPTILAFGAGRNKRPTVVESNQDHPAWAALEIISTVLRLTQGNVETD